MRRCLAIDIGASSGRHIVGWKEDGALQTEEVFRFPNGVTEREGRLVWDVAALLENVKEGIAAAKARFGEIDSLAIDTWGVDYVLLRGEKEILPCYAYRDDGTKDAVAAVHAITPFSELYRRTGCQFQPFNTIYKLFSDKRRLDDATDFLMMPEYLLYKLCGVKAHEYTNATTTGLVSAQTGEYDMELIDALGLPRRLFHSLQKPGTVLGSYEGIQVVLCATHDTASAVEGIPPEGNCPYISSGTWSLLGVKTEKPVITEAGAAANWSNEGGVGYNRYQKNIMGMWLVNRLRDELCPDKAFSEIVSEAEASDFAETVNADDPAFLSPKSMRAAVSAALAEKPKSAGDYFRCAYRSLAQAYAQAISELETNVGKTYDKITVVGGGAKNAFLNRLTEEASGKRVVALPIEATALGNLKIQLEAET